MPYRQIVLPLFFQIVVANRSHLALLQLSHYWTLLRLSYFTKAFALATVLVEASMMLTEVEDSNPIVTILDVAGC